MTSAVEHEPQRQRFVLHREGEEAVLDYRIHDEGRVLHLVRTWVPPRFRGGGLGAMLVKAGLEHARREGYRVTTSCWFVEEYVDAFPEYRELMAS